MNSEEDRSEARQRLYGLLGELPERNGSMTVRQVAVESSEKYRLERLLIDCNGRESVPALFLSPLEAQSERRPVVLYIHANGDDWELGKNFKPKLSIKPSSDDWEIGKNELLIGRRTLQCPPYGEALVAVGCSVLCIDLWGFGERRGLTVDSLFKEMLWQGEVLWGRMIYDNLRMIDYLVTRPDVDPARIATLGMSTGGAIAWWCAALDQRIKVCVDICCLSDYQSLIDHDALDGCSIDYFVPDLLRHFSMAEINALIAPRAHLSLAGNNDPLTPREGLDRIDRILRDEYAQLGASDKWRLSRYECGHFETAAMRAEVMMLLTNEL